jgi:hypothetical protein
VEIIAYVTNIIVDSDTISKNDLVQGDRYVLYGLFLALFAWKSNIYYNINNGEDDPYNPYFLGKLVSSQKILIFSGAN